MTCAEAFEKPPEVDENVTHDIVNVQDRHFVVSVLICRKLQQGPEMWQMTIGRNTRVNDVLTKLGVSGGALCHEGEMDPLSPSRALVDQVKQGDRLTVVVLLAESTAPLGG